MTIRELKWIHSGNENENEEMKTNSLRNGNEMSPAGRGSQNENRQMKVDSLLQ